MTPHEEATEMQAYLETLPEDNPDALSERIKILAVYQARSGHMLAEAKKNAIREEKDRDSKYYHCNSQRKLPVSKSTKRTCGQYRHRRTVCGRLVGPYQRSV